MQVMEPVMTLADLQTDVLALVEDVEEVGSTGERLMELGLIRNTPIRIVRRGLFGDPLQIALRGYTLMLRKAQAARILIRQCASP